MVMKLKNSNCDKIKKNQIVIKLKNSNCDETQHSNGDETQKLKLWWNSKIQIEMKLKKKLQNSKTIFFWN